MIARPLVKGKPKRQVEDPANPFPAGTKTWLRWLEKGATNYSYEDLGIIEPHRRRVRRAEKEVELMRQREAPTPASDPNAGRVPVAGSISQYLDDTRRGKSRKTYQAYCTALLGFRESLAKTAETTKTAPRQFLDEIRQSDLEQFRLALIEQKYQARSVKNILGNVHCFLMLRGLMVSKKPAPLLPGKLTPSVTLPPQARARRGLGIITGSRGNSRKMIGSFYV